MKILFCDTPIKGCLADCTKEVWANGFCTMEMRLEEAHWNVCAIECAQILLYNLPSLPRYRAI